MTNNLRFCYIRSKDETAEISGTAKQEGGKSSIGAAASKQISVNDQVNVKLNAEINKESNSKTQTQIGADVTVQ